MAGLCVTTYMKPLAAVGTQLQRSDVDGFNHSDNTPQVIRLDLIAR